jgi:DNA-binding LacI/PurR family transcriptional regulator
MSSSPPTSHDVARLAGVSQSTVSNALTGKGTISEQTRERVLQVARSIGYRPNLAARSMRTRRSGRLAVVTSVALENQMRLLAGAGEAARGGGYLMEPQAVEGAVDQRTERVLELAASRQYEGILTFLPLLPAALEGSDEAAPVVAAMAVDENLHTTGDLADASMIEVFVRTLAAAGHRRFVHIAGSQQFASARARRKAYVATVDELGLESLGVLAEEWDPEASRAAIHSLPDNAPPVAIIAANDHLAIGALRGATERGWSVPGDLVLTGWDNAPFSGFTSPSLTTVAVDFVEAGRAAMRLLIATLESKPPPPAAMSLQHIVWRESTGFTGPTQRGAARATAEQGGSAGA